MLAAGGEPGDARRGEHTLAGYHAGMGGTARSALLVAHPGHELRVHGWLERERPLVFVLTDGSGNAGISRLPSTCEVLRRAGARPGPVFGRFSDREIYEVILEGRIDALTALVHEIAAALDEEKVDQVACDAIEGFNPSHDLCRLLAGAAVAATARRAGLGTGHPPVLYDFLLEGRPDGAGGARDLRLELDRAELERKLAAARTYPEMAGEVERALARHGAERFRIECLRAVAPEVGVEDLVTDPPFYELHGERQVAAGQYRRVLRFREHFLPVARALRELGCPGAAL